MDAEALCYQLFDVNLREYQRDFFKDFVKSPRDFFISQPTGSGKSLLFQALPFIKELESNRGTNFSAVIQQCRWVVLVVTPLIALMADQVDILGKRGIKCLSLSESVEDSTQESMLKVLKVFFDLFL